VNVSVSVRPATKDDLEEIVALERGVAEAPHWSASEYELIIRQAGEQSGVRRCLVVAEIDRELVGFAVGKVVSAAELGELESVAVRASARRVGVGMRLCREVLEWCRRQGAARMELEVRVRSAGARELYERLGFVVEGFRRGYYTEPADDAVLMRLDFVGEHAPSPAETIR
jgi:[ribosomal protein S18]-alanine N-acetyltransferase